MIKLIAKKDFSTPVKDYIAGDEIETNNYDTIVRLNQQGFIEPLTYRDLVLIKRELENKSKTKKEEVL